MLLCSLAPGTPPSCGHRDDKSDHHLKHTTEYIRNSKPVLTFRPLLWWRRLCWDCIDSAGWGCHHGALSSCQRNLPSQTAVHGECYCPTRPHQHKKRSMPSVLVNFYISFGNLTDNTKIIYLFYGTDRGDVVTLSAPLFRAVVLPPVRHVPQVLTTPVVLMFITHPSTRKPQVLCLNSFTYLKLAQITFMYKW